MGASFRVFSLSSGESLAKVLNASSWIVLDHELRIPMAIWVVIQQLVSAALLPHEHDALSRHMSDHLTSDDDQELSGRSLKEASNYLTAGLQAIKREKKTDLEQAIQLAQKKIPTHAPAAVYTTKEYEADLQLVIALMQYAVKHDLTINHWIE